MKLVRKEDLKSIGAERKRVRPGSLEVIRMMVGTPGTPGNFFFTLGSTQSDYHTPRHRHNFEQIRFQLRGEFDYEREGKMTEGTVGYFPEGAFYGPSRSGDGSVILLLQFGGASGSGYMSHDEYAEGLASLSKRGTFHDGIYTWLDSTGKKHNKDGYEAVWEESRQTELKYPKPRYEKPIYMRPENFSWQPSPDEAGVAFKRLGTFSDREVRVGLVRFDAGASTSKLPGGTLYFVLSGKGSAGGEAWHAESAMHLDRDESAEIRATEPSELFYIGLPDLEGLAVPAHQHQKVAAAA
ncbi:MAG: hypothetical protein EXR28_01355 [Betaproteobacteria bacterium]|nr:hypothetical protein [Betaproteobacteria bacterium]